MDSGAPRAGRGRLARRAGAFLGSVPLAAMGWGWFEAGWARLRRLEVYVPGLPPELDGMRIAHLSDFHLGVPSRGARAVQRGVAWAASLQPDITAVTGDLLTHPRGEQRLRALAAQLPAPAFAVLGNHDVAVSRDPQARASNLSELEPVTLLRDEGVLVDVRGKRVWIAGTYPRAGVGGTASRDPSSLSRDDADLRILLCHFPRTFDRLEPSRFDLVLAGHMHDGQIALPYPGGKIRFAHLRAKYQTGVYRGPAGVMHVSPGLGTTFVPFRFAARPEATELVLRSSRE